MGDGICSLVMALTEDRSIESFAERKHALRDQVRAAGPRAIAVFAADKLSDIRGLQRGIEPRQRIDRSANGHHDRRDGGHYRESVMIDASDPASCFIPALHQRTQQPDHPSHIAASSP